MQNLRSQYVPMRRVFGGDYPRSVCPWLLMIAFGESPYGARLPGYWEGGEWCEHEELGVDLIRAAGEED